MRRYDDPVEVRRGPVPGAPGEGPEQFLWRGRLWKVRAVLAHWVESAPWWQSEAVLAVVGADAVRADVGGRAVSVEPAGSAGSAAGGSRLDAGTLLREQEWWKVRAGRGSAAPEGRGDGVFDLCFDPGDGCWRLKGCED